MWPDPDRNAAHRQGAKLLNAERAFDAADALEQIADLCGQAPGDCILSCEDLSGILPGTRRVREVYPALWRNIAALDAALEAFDTRYYFFLRDPDDWIKSAYVQNLKHRQKFSKLEGFTQFLKSDRSVGWRDRRGQSAPAGAVRADRLPVG